MANILLIDDDIEVLTINQKYLHSEGYTVYTSDIPKEAIALAKKIQPDCIVLDIMMPQLNGYDVCNALRKFTSAPIIFLTGKSSEEDKIKGLTSGADDYLIKPYSLRELKARIDIHIRRNQQPKPLQDKNTLIFSNLCIDKISHKVLYKNNDLCLTNREYDLLLYLATHPNQDVTFEELGAALFGTYQEADRRSVMVNVSRLRKKMAIDFELENMIETVWSKGYRFIAK